VDTRATTDVKSMFIIGTSYTFHLNNQQEIIGHIQGVNIVNGEWVIIVKDNSTGCIRNIIFGTISNWSQTPPQKVA
jgi:hypothetical protein